jgi:MFS family permease
MPAIAEVEPRSGSAGSPPSALTPLPSSTAVYSSAFWLAYAANVAAVTANALTYRFAELVDFLGGREQVAGTIIGVATAAALISRVFLGQAIDRYGVRRLWVASSLVFVAGGALLTIADGLSWPLYVARSLFAIGLAGMFTCSTVHIQSLVPAHRRTEVIGSLGSSGFVGMIIGALLGDAIFHGMTGQTRFTALFGVSTVLGACYAGLVLYLTRRERHVRPAETPAVHRLLLRYWPGNVMLVAFVMGLMLAVTTVFLTRFATHKGLSGLGPFFVGYAGSAFTFRLVARQWSRTVGRHRMILLGLAGHATAMLLLPFVTSEWLFCVPAVFGGFGHALLFPAVVSLGSEAFPREYRGTGTTIVMGFFDVGTFVSAPILGGIIDLFGGHGFTPMFLFAAAVAAIVAFVYLLTGARTVDRDLVRESSTGSESLAGGSWARGMFASRHSPIEPFAPKSFVGEESASQPFARRQSDGQRFVCEGSTAGILAGEESAPQISAREANVKESWAAASAQRAAIRVPATRCR